jgi:hypothetical protein
MLRQGIAEGGGPFLQKPFTTQQLAKTVREALLSAARAFAPNPAGAR